MLIDTIINIQTGEVKKIYATPEEIENILNTPDPIPTLEEQRYRRKSAYSQEADPLGFKMLRGEVTLEEWKAKVEEIRQRYPYPEN